MISESVWTIRKKLECENAVVRNSSFNGENTVFDPVALGKSFKKNLNSQIWRT